jgi:hypothetical protein
MAALSTSLVAVGKPQFGPGSNLMVCRQFHVSQAHSLISVLSLAPVRAHFQNCTLKVIEMRFLVNLQREMANFNFGQFLEKIVFFYCAQNRNQKANSKTQAKC